MSNKLIAEFMGYTGGSDFQYLTHPETLLDTNVDELLYQTSWDWLLPVVSECREKSNAEDSHWEAVCYSFEGCNIDVTYQAVVEFIKWYNQNKEDE